MRLHSQKRNSLSPAVALELDALRRLASGRPILFNDGPDLVAVRARDAGGRDWARAHLNARLEELGGAHRSGRREAWRRFSYPAGFDTAVRRALFLRASQPCPAMAAARTGSGR